MANERICKCCGKEYKYCPNCKRYIDLPQWMLLFDSDECKDVFNAVSGYNMGVFGKEKVKEALDKYGVTDLGKYKESISSVLTNLFAEEQVAEVSETIEEIPVVEKKRLKKNKKKVDIVLENETGADRLDSNTEGIS